MAIMISIPAGATANQASTLSLSQNLGSTITQTEANINQTLTQIDCSLASGFEGFGFRPSDMGNFTPGQQPGGSGSSGTLTLASSAEEETYLDSLAAEHSQVAEPLQ